jgi:hypothetical protein
VNIGAKWLRFIKAEAERNICALYLGRCDNKPRSGATLGPLAVQAGWTLRSLHPCEAARERHAFATG